jgi:hypothetical protein
MKKPLRFTIETQTEDNEIISICHLNEKTIALELSDVARTMFKLNRSLFDKINSSTKLLGGLIYREQIKISKQDRNKLGVKLLDKYDHDDVQIISLDFTQGTMQKRQSILTKNGRRIDFDPATLKYKEDLGPLDPQNLTFDDVEMSTMICEVEEIELFQDAGIKTYMLKDFMKDVEGLYQVAYRFEVRADTEFKEYVEFLIKELEKSITFLLSYSNSIDAPLNYDSNNFEFKKSFKDSILKQLGIEDVDVSTNLGTNRIKNSEFGRAALNYYNGLLLLRQGVQKSIYGQIIKNLLPTSKTSPENIKLTLNNFNRLVERIRREYNIYNKDSKSSRFVSKVSSKKFNTKEFVSITTEKMNIERETLGYNIFSETQKGLNKFTTSTYRQRIGAEQTKYYPSMDVADDTKFMTSKERSAFMANSNAPSFVTPANLVMGNKKITCSRGMANMDVNMIREFRVAKSARAVQMQKTNYPSSLGNASLSQNVMADFNITIGVPKKAILERATDIEIDPMQDAKNYVGESSYFTTNNPEFIYRNFQRLLDSQDMRIFAIVSDVIPGRFLRQNDSIQSIKELQISNKKSRLRGLVAEEKINLEEIPPQIKSMMTKSFQNNPNIDPLKNRESRAIIDETQKNVFQVRAHTGFEMDEDGFPDLNRPIIQQMSEASLSGKPMLAKAYNYEVPELGIVKDKFMPTIYNNLLYVRG